MVYEPPSRWDRRVDVLVIGSGTGLAAALAADDGGADVLVLEKAPLIGGTTAVSGGGSWVPNSRPVRENGAEVPREELLGYLRRITGGRTPEAKLQRYVDEAPEVFEFLEATTALTFVHAVGTADYHAEFEGGSIEGHVIVPDIYDGRRLGDRLDDVRRSPHLAPVTYEEIEAAGGSDPTRANEAMFEVIRERREADQLSVGMTLVVGLYEALLDRGVEFECEAPASSLVVDDGRVIGVVAEIDGEETVVEAAAVVIAVGGLE